MMRRAPRTLGWLLLAGLALVSAARVAAFELTAEERAWVAANPIVKVGFSPSFPPYSFPDDHGQMQGIDLDYLELVARRTGLRFEPVVLPSWPAVEVEFYAGRLDMLTLLVGSQQQRESLLLTRPYLSVPRVIVTRTSSPYLLRPEDLHGLRVGEVQGHLPREGLMRDLLAQSTIVEFEGVGQMLDALASGKIDATVSDSVNAAYSIRSRHLTNLRLGSVVAMPRETFMGVARNKPLLAAIVDKALADITTAERRAIDERWVSLEVEPSKWLLAFQVAVGVGVVALLVFLALYAHSRRLARELAERRKIQARLERTHAQLAEVSEKKTELLRMVAHDIRGPLTGMLLSADLANYVDAGDEKALRNLLARLRQTTASLQRLVNDLVDAQATEDGVRRYAREPVDVAHLLRQTTANLQETAAGKGIELRLETEEDGMTISSDQAALRQVVDNLLFNALKFTPPGTVVHVSATWLPAGGLRLAVADQGPGISVADRERIFARYGKGAAAPTGGEKSTGLGLWIVDRVVTGLKGTVRCDSELGRGATFVVELPPSVPTVAAV